MTTKASSGKQTVVPQPRGAGRAIPEDSFAAARKVLADSIGIDSHIDTVQRALVMSGDLAKRWDVGHVDLPRLREGGMR